MNTHVFVSSSGPVVLLVLLLSLAACTEQQTADTDTADTAQTTMDTSAAAAMDTTAAGAVVQVAQNDTLGAYLTDGDGRALYLFLKDEKGSGQSTCYDACAQAWPPFTASQGSPTARGKAQAALLDTLERRDGATQVTYNGWPLYYFSKDQGAGQVKGQDVEGFGAEWYLVSPKGTEVHAE